MDDRYVCQGGLQRPENHEGKIVTTQSMLNCRPLAVLIVSLAMSIAAQARQQGRGAPAAPPTARAAAPVDLTGYWVAIISEDWRWRMITPAKGDYPSIPLNIAGQR